MDKLTFVTAKRGQYFCIQFNEKVSDNVSYALRDIGYQYDKETMSYKGSCKYAEEAVTIAERAVKLSTRAREAAQFREETLCWTCGNSGHGRTSICPWEREFKPVDGWNAEYSDGSDSRKTDSYLVIECPLFIKEPERKPKYAKQRTMPILWKSETRLVRTG